MRQHWATGFAHMMKLHGLHTVRDFMVLLRTLSQLDRQHAPRRPGTQGPPPLPPGRKHEALLTALYGTAPLPQGLTVRKATLLQLAGPLAEQHARRAVYTHSALSADAQAPPSAEAVSTATQQLEASMRHVWRIPWENMRKETLWRLTVNGIPGAGGHDLCPRIACACGWEGPDASMAADEQRASAIRQHCFWTCPVARGVIAQLTTALPPSTPVSCGNVWLLQPPLPSPALHVLVWHVVCLAALEAMHYGHKALWAMHKEAEAPRAGGQTLVTDFFTPAVPTALPLSPTEKAARKAGAHFWCLVQDFVPLGQSASALPLGPNHPFIACKDGRLVLNCPAACSLPDSI